MKQRVRLWFITGSTWLLVIVLILALCLRLWGINFGLPYLYHPDEPGNVTVAQNIFKTGDLNPHFFNYPSLFFYLNGLAYVVYFLLGKWMGLFRIPSDVPFPQIIAMGCGTTPMPTTFVMGRLLTVLFGVATVFLVYHIGWRLLGSKQVGLLASLMLAISPTHVSHSQLITPDAFLVFFILLSFLGSVGVLKEGRSRDYVLAGLGAGLAASTKYNGALILVSLIAAHSIRYGRCVFKRCSLYLGIGLSVAAFLLTTPFALLDWEAFRTGVQFELRHYATGHAGMEGNTLKWYISYLLTIEGPIAFLAILESIRSFSARSKNTLALSIFPITYFVFINRLVVRNDRTLLPLIPFLLLLAAQCAIEAFNRTRYSLFHTRFFRAAFTILISSLLIIVPLYRTIQSNLRRCTVDSRETARVWIEDNLPPGAKIAVEAYSPFVNPQRFVVLGTPKITDFPLTWYIDEQFDYLVFAEGMFGRFYREPQRYAEEIGKYEVFFRNLEPVRIFSDGGYEVRIYQLSHPSK